MGGADGSVLTDGAADTVGEGVGGFVVGASVGPVGEKVRDGPAVTVGAPDGS